MGNLIGTSVFETSLQRKDYCYLLSALNTALVQMMKVYCVKIFTVDKATNLKTEASGGILWRVRRK
jgi:hypothetical protein